MGTTGFGLTNQLPLLSTQGFPVPNKKAPLINKKNCSKPNTQTESYSLTLPADLTKIDEDIKHFWNSLSTAIHYTLWQPHQTELPEPDSHSSNGSSNYQVGESNYWKNQIIPNNSTQQPSLHSSLHLSIPTTGNEVQNAITSQKIIIYPNEENLWFEALNLFRRAYNLSIGFMRKGRKPHSEFRTQICDWCLIECEQNETNYNSNLVQAAYRKACETRSTVIKKRANRQKAEMSFMSRNAPKQYFVAPKLSPKKQIFPKILEGCTWTEEVPNEAVGKTVIVTYANGQWFASVRFYQSGCEVKTEKLSIVALDPGVRTFQTAFSGQDATQYGDKFVESKLVPLMLALDSLLSHRDKLHGEDQSKQWVQDILKNINALIHQVRIRQQNLVAYLHRRVAYDLVSNYDVILLPTFETKQMVKKSNETRKLFLIRKTVRGMLGLAHYKFKQTLKWMANKYGKTIVDANESYTSKTLWDGSILNNLGGKTSILYQGKRVNRDVHGARNIFILFLTKVIDGLSPQEACSFRGKSFRSANENFCLENISKAGFCGFSVFK